MFFWHKPLTSNATLHAHAQDCANTLWALGTLKLYPPAEWLEAMQEETFSQLPYFTSQHCANVMWAWARLSHWPPEVGVPVITVPLGQAGTQGQHASVAGPPLS